MTRTFDAEEARMGALHARWVHEALLKGEITALKQSQLDDAFERGIARAKARKQASVSTYEP